MHMLSFDVEYAQLTLPSITDSESGLYEINQLLILLVRSLFVFSNENPKASQSTVKHLLDAMTSIFECPELACLQKSLISLISNEQINTYIVRNCMDFERV
jgi:hypothetical protein